MRVVTIIGALLIGLVGLFMSVCGGGVFIFMGYATVRSMFVPGPRDLFSGLSMVVFPLASLMIGAALCWLAFKLIRGHVDKRRKAEEDRLP